ncbi:hypothetical protein L0244_09200, partial [bacterium]|nr:hypothetical protein [bacterium]
ERDRLRTQLDTELVFTIRDAKGLEFRSVILWNFGNDPKTTAIWESILSQETNTVVDAVIRHELSLLYVGITRAQRNLVIYDSGITSPIWSHNRFSDFVFRTNILEILETTWQAASTREEWKQQGDYLMEHEHYRAAAECYRNAQETNLMHRASAKAAELKGEFLAAAQHWEQAGELLKSAEYYETVDHYEEASRIWQLLQNEDRAEYCIIRKLEKERRFDEAAKLCEQRQEFGRAKENWLKAARYDRLAAIFELEEDWHHAAEAYTRNGTWERAAELYERAKSYELAAQAYEKSSKYDHAARLWAESGNTDNCLRCLTIHGDHKLLAQFWIDQKEWLSAYESLTKLAPSAALDFIATLPPRLARTNGIKAIKFTLENDLSKAAVEWEKLKESSMAAQLFLQAGSLTSAARNYFRAKDWQNALLLYAQASKNAKVSPPGFHQTINKILSEHYPNGRQKVAEYAQVLYDQNLIRSAKNAYMYIGLHSKAAQCAWELDEQEFAIHCWTIDAGAEETISYLSKHKLYRPGLEILNSLLEHHSKTTGRNVVERYEKLLTEWWRTERNSETANSMRDLLLSSPFHFSMPFYMEIMEFAGDYDSIYRTLELQVHSMSSRDLKYLNSMFLEQARDLEKRDPAGAGLRYLVIEHYEKAQQCWREVSVSRMIRYCLESAGLQDKLLEHYEANEDWIEAAFLYDRVVDIENSVKCWIKGGKPMLGASILESGRHYEAALRLYDVAGDQLMAAKMLEKLKRFDEAAARYEQSGDRVSFLRCAAKVKSRSKQLKLSR